MTDSMTDVKIRSLVRRQIICALEDDLTGGELLMKEVWEQCETFEHGDAARRELEELVALLRDRERRLGED